MAKGTMMPSYKTPISAAGKKVARELCRTKSFGQIIAAKFLRSCRKAR
ncbi:MAG: hypothetical protein WA672_12760 [Candidatus Angelobacter sp.]